MDKIIINGGHPLNGSIEVSGTKNSALAIIIGSLLIEDKCVIENLPDIMDVEMCFKILKFIGSSIRRIGKSTYEIDNRRAVGGIAPYDLVSKMRASAYLLGAELGRYGKAHVAHPGGCDFGNRPLDLHIMGFEALGAAFTTSEGGYYSLFAPEGLHSAQIYLDFPSVGATVNLILASVRTPDINVVIDNAAREPHIVDLANFLNACGANISGAGTDVIKIKGVSHLHGCTYAIIPDMIEVGTYMACAAAAGGHLTITNVIPKHMEAVTAKMMELGAEIDELDDAIIVERIGHPLNRGNLKTLPYPGIPTDMNPQLCVLLCLANGTSTLTEGVWDNRFRYVDELARMSANIKVEGRTATVEGRGRLTGAAVRAVDLRAGAAMIIAGLAAKGRTEIEDIYHIERGYEDIVNKLRSVGADIKVISTPDHENYEKAN